MKDPLALFSAEWLSRAFQMDVVIIIRHPAAFAASLIKAGWTTLFADFLTQPALMQRHLLPFEAEIVRFSERQFPILDQAILLWRMIHYAIHDYQTRHSGWRFVRHEDLSREPEAAFEVLYRDLDLEMTPDAAAFIARHCGRTNPVETRATFDLKVDSRRNITRWQNRLSKADVERVKCETEDVWRYFYKDFDWRPSR